MVQPSAGEARTEQENYFNLVYFNLILIVLEKHHEGFYQRIFRILKLSNMCQEYFKSYEALPLGFTICMRDSIITLDMLSQSVERNTVLFEDGDTGNTI